MARTRLIRSDSLPYHLYGRSNNKEWFYLPLDYVWEIFTRKLRYETEKSGFQLHAFVLMSNHYHALASSPIVPIDQVMCRLLKRVSDEINFRADRINHVFGGPYKWTLIQNAFQYRHVFRYVYQNPVRAGLCEDVRDYPFSSLRLLRAGQRSGLPLVSHRFEQSFLESSKTLCADEWFAWLNEIYDREHAEALRRALYRRKFAFTQSREFRRVPAQFIQTGGQSDGAPFSGTK